MHELSLAEAVVEIAERTAAGRRVVRVELAVGALRQVVPDALEFGFALLAQGTPVEGAELAIEEVPVRLACRACGAATEADGFPLACADCGGLDVDVADGEQLEVVALELESEPVAAVRR